MVPLEYHPRQDWALAAQDEIHMGQCTLAHLAAATASLALVEEADRLLRVQGQQEPEAVAVAIPDWVPGVRRHHHQEAVPQAVGLNHRRHRHRRETWGAGMKAKLVGSMVFFAQESVLGIDRGRGGPSLHDE